MRLNNKIIYKIMIIIIKVKIKKNNEEKTLKKINFKYSLYSKRINYYLNKKL